MAACTASDNARALELATRSAQIDDELMAALERWEELGKTSLNRFGCAWKAPSGYRAAVLGEFARKYDSCQRPFGGCGTAVFCSE